VKKLLILATLISLLGLQSCSTSDSAEQDKLKVANDMVQAWNDRDWEQMFQLFAEDGVLHSVGKKPMNGREEIRERLAGLLAGIDQIELKILNMGVVNDVVFLERADDFIFNGRHGVVPVVGVMEIENGKVKVWREYYDHKTLADAVAPSPKPEAEVLAEAENEIRTLTENLQTDWNGGDMSAYLDAYWNDEELSLLFGGRAVRGWQALSDLFRSSWTSEEEMGDFTVNEIVVRLHGTNIAIASGSFEHQFISEKIAGSFSHVWRRFEDGNWLIVHEHTSRALKH
jgi:limonene-1,2-epoxide hydrolase